MKRISALLVSLAMVLGLSLAVASPASAVPAGCTSGWSAWNTNYAAPFWGQVRWCSAYEGYGRYLQFQVQDIYTDGYSVHLEACTDTSTYTCTVGGYGDAFLPSWGHIILDSGSGGTCPQSSGAVDTTAWPSIGVPNNPPQNTTYVRLVRGRCSPHQDVASVYFRIQGI